MENHHCPNYQDCRLVITEVVTADEKQKREYLSLYCKKDESHWGNCKRYTTKKILQFCPDFVLPDTLLSIDEIMDKFEEETSISSNGE